LRSGLHNVKIEIMLSLFIKRDTQDFNVKKRLLDWVSLLILDW